MLHSSVLPPNDESVNVPEVFIAGLGVMPPKNSSPSRDTDINCDWSKFRVTREKHTILTWHPTIVAPDGITIPSEKSEYVVDTSALYTSSLAVPTSSVMSYLLVLM